MTSLPTVQMLWLGGTLSELQRLSIRSFVAHGHPVRLFTFGPVDGVPAGAEVVDAETVLARDLVLRPDGSPRGDISPTVASDWFRFALLARDGGLWADLDVVCLRPFVFDRPVVLAWEDDEYLATCVLGFPAGHPMTVALVEQCERPWRSPPWEHGRANVSRALRRLRFAGRPWAFRRSLPWGASAGPRGVTPAAHHFGVDRLAYPVSAFCPIHYSRLEDLVRADDPPRLDDLRAASWGVHLWGALWSLYGWDENAAPPPGSLMDQLYRACP